MLRSILTALMLVLFPVVGGAQVTTKALTSTTCSAPTSAGCLITGTTGRGTMSVQITGTFVGTLQFEQTVNGTTWVTWTVIANGTTDQATSTTSTGFWTGAVTAQQVRIRFSAYTSGTATVSVIAIDARASTGTGGGGSGEPGGVNGALQYNSSGSFGGSNFLWSGSAITTSQGGPMFQWSGSDPTDNGTFQFHGGSAAVDTDPRADNIFAIGWNADHSNATSGGVRLIFESHCGPDVGCPLPGQSETYFAASDGVAGHAETRPFGIFQTQDPEAEAPDTRLIFRGTSFGFWDQTQTYAVLSISDQLLTTVKGTFTGIGPGDVSYTDWLFQDGQSLVRSKLGGVALAPNSDVSLGGTGEVNVDVVGNHFRMASVSIEDLSGNTRFRMGAGQATNFPKFNAAGTDEVQVQGDGSSTNIKVAIIPKGTGGIDLKPGTGALRIDNVAGVTASGTSCTITAITKGIITGASCTP